MSEGFSPAFKLVDVDVTEEGIVLIHPDEAEAQRSYCEGQLRGFSLRLDGVRIVWLAEKTDPIDRQQADKR